MPKERRTKMRKMKRVLAMVLATTLVGALFAGCGKKENKVGDDYNGGKEVEISYWNSGLGTKFLEEMVGEPAFRGGHHRREVYSGTEG